MGQQGTGLVYPIRERLKAMGLFHWVLIRNSLPEAMMVGKQNWTKILSILSCAESVFGRERLTRIYNNYSQILKFLIQTGYRYF